MYASGDQVVEHGMMGAVGTVVSGPAIHGGEAYYRVNFNGRIKNILEEDLSRYTGEQDPESLLRAGQFGDQVAFARRLTMSKLRRPLRDAVYSYKASRTEFHAYQFKPLLKFLASERRRLLIADEVGLGKTIEAGYILQEERARFGIQRVLVVCPAALRVKWQNELWQRFGENFEILDRQSFMGKALVRPGHEGRGLPRFAGIVSLQSVRGDKVIDAVEQRGAALDLLIVDEAHHCRNSDTKQHRVVRGLSDSSEATVLLTATPIHLGDENLFNLLRLLLPEEFDKFEAFRDRLEVNRSIVDAEVTLRRGGDGWEARTLATLRGVERTFQADRFLGNPVYSEACDLLAGGPVQDKAAVVRIQENLSQLNLLTPVMTRTRKREVYPDAAKREPHVVRVEMTADEAAVYEELSEFCFEHYASSSGDFAARFALISLQRQLASSLHATVRHYAKHADSIGWESDIEADFGEDNDSVEDSTSRPSILQRPEFFSLIDDCQSRLRGPDTKLQAVLQILRGTAEKVVVFSYFKKSLRYLEDALQRAGIGCVRIDGDVPSNPQEPENDERTNRIHAFRDDRATRVLLSSEVGSEGLDFQFCHMLVNWDLPWNPMVVEQRIGRLDRLGQRSEKILVFSFSCPGTIEDVILSRLYTRIGVFERTIGVIEPILGQEIRELTDTLFRTKLSAEEREALIEQKALVLAQRARDEERLESESANLVGQDEFFSEQIERVRRLGRFVTGEELRILIEECLETEHPRCSLSPANRGSETGEARDATVWRLKVDESLRDFVRKPLARNDPELLRFLDRSQSGTLLVSFSGEAVMSDNRVELITATHPLVRAIARHYDENPTLVHPVTAVQVPSDVVSKGEYLFLWASVEETGMRAGRSMWAVLLSADGQKVPGGEQAEELLHHMVLSGGRWEEFEAPPAEFTHELLERALGILAERHVEYRRDVVRRNTNLIEQRLASLEASYRIKRAERERRLEENRLRGNVKVVPLFEAQLRKLESDFDESCRRIEERRKVSVSWTVEGGGYVRVV